MDPVEPTTAVWHGYYGDLRVVAAPEIPEAVSRAEQAERLYGPGTWCIKEAIHQQALTDVANKKQPKVSGEDFHWVPWMQLKRRDVD